MSHRRAFVLPTIAAAIASVGLQFTGPAAAAEEVSTSQQRDVRVNARWTPVVDSQGREWGARGGFTGSRTNRSDRLKGQDIAGTAEDVLYQASLFGMDGFRAPVPHGDYRVRLLMAEVYHTAPGRRVFDVTAEGRPALSGVDIAAEVGRGHAYDRTFDVTVDDGMLDLGFVARVDQPLVAAIEIVPIPVVDKAADGVDSVGVPVPMPTDDPEPLPPMYTSASLNGGGKAPVVSGDVVTSVVSGGTGRSEIWWNTQEAGRVRLDRGTIVTTEFDVRLEVSDPVTGTAPSPNTWHTIFQLHGPTKAGTWLAPPVSVAWQDGTFRVGGGSRVQNSDGSITSAKGSWYQPYLPVPEKQWTKVEVQTYLDGPGRGWISMWVDGERYMDRWKPTAGTMYTDSGDYSHKEINVKSGLYTGGSAPSWTRTVQQRGLAISWSEPGGAETSAALR